MNSSTISPIDTTIPTVAPVHPAAAIFPPLDGHVFEQLVADIRAHGLHEPGWLDRAGETILDGRNRARACKAAGVEMRWRRYEGEPGTEIAFIVSANLVRRHLTEDQRAAIAAELATMRQGERTDLSPNGGRLSQAQAATAMQVSTRQVQRAAQVKQAAPELHEAVKAGTVKIREATKQIASSRSKRGRKQKATKTAHPSLAVILAALPGLDLGALRRVQAAVEKIIAQRAGGDVQK